MTQPLTRYVTIRLSQEDHKRFHDKARDYGNASQVLRELIEAFIDDRLTVMPNPNKKVLYHVIGK